MRTLILILLAASVAGAQAPDTAWTRLIYNAGGTWIDEGVEAHDGGGLVTGVYATAGKWDSWLVRFRPAGDTAWTRRFGGAWGDYGRDLVRMGDTGFVLLGKRQTAQNGEYYVWLLGLDTSGTKTWEKILPRTENPWGLTLAADSGFGIAASYESASGSLFDIVVIRTSWRGEVVWTKRFGGPLDDVAEAIVATPDSGFLVLANTKSYGAGNTDLYLLKVDKKGDSLWARTFGGSQYDVAKQLEPTSDGNFIIVGGTYSFGVSGNLYAVKIAPNGTVIWEAKVGGPNATAYDCEEAPDGGFLLAGTVYVSSKNSVYLARIDRNGQLLWTKTVVTASHETPAFVHRLPGDFPFVIASHASSSGLYAVKYTQEVVGVAEEAGTLPGQPFLRQNFPNPFNAGTMVGFAIPFSTRVMLRVYDLLGQEVEILADEERPPGVYECYLDASGYSSGVYFLRMDAGGVVQTRRMVLLR